jgi:hypothetical protein
MNFYIKESNNARVLEWRDEAIRQFEEAQAVLAQDLEDNEAEERASYWANVIYRCEDELISRGFHEFKYWGI